MTDQVAQQGAVVEKGAGVPQDARVLDGGMGSKAPDVAAIHALVTACEALGKEAAVCYQGTQANSRLGNGYAEVAEHLRVVDGHLLNARAALVLGADRAARRNANARQNGSDPLGERIKSRRAGRDRHRLRRPAGADERGRRRNRDARSLETVRRLDYRPDRAADG